MMAILSTPSPQALKKYSSNHYFFTWHLLIKATINAMSIIIRARPTCQFGSVRPYHSDKCQFGHVLAKNIGSAELCRSLDVIKQIGNLLLITNFVVLYL